MRVEPESQSVRIKLIDGTTVRGKLNLMSEKKQMDRLSDYFIKGENPFIALYGVRAHGGSDFMVVNKQHIIWIMPEE